MQNTIERTDNSIIWCDGEVYATVESSIEDKYQVLISDLSTDEVVDLSELVETEADAVERAWEHTSAPNREVFERLIGDDAFTIITGLVLRGRNGRLERQEALNKAAVRVLIGNGDIDEIRADLINEISTVEDIVQDHIKNTYRSAYLGALALARKQML